MRRGDFWPMVAPWSRSASGISSTATPWLWSPSAGTARFRALDISFSKTLKDARLLGRLLAEMFELIEGGHIGPIRPITTYGFDNVPAALACIRRGQHIGKIVIAKGQKTSKCPYGRCRGHCNFATTSPISSSEASRVFAAVLLCTLARHGARHIIVCSRSGIDDETSARVARGCRSYGCEVTGEQGDICDMAFVRRVFESAQPWPIAGVIQGAMVLGKFILSFFPASRYFSPASML